MGVTHKFGRELRSRKIDHVKIVFFQISFGQQQRETYKKDAKDRTQ